MNKQMTSAEYHADPAIGSSSLFQMISQTPMHYKCYVDNPRESTEAMKLGSAVHAAILENDLFKTQYVVRPEGLSFATKEGKLWRDSHKDRETITHDQSKAIAGILESLRGHSKAQELLSGGLAEQSFFWECPDTGLRCKIRPDYLAGNTVVDIKTTDSIKSFPYSIKKYGYNHQAAFYTWGMSHILQTQDINYYWIVIEKMRPHAIRIYKPSPKTISDCKVDIFMALQRIKYCQDNNYWPGYEENVTELDVPYFGNLEEGEII